MRGNNSALLSVFSGVKEGAAESVLTVRGLEVLNKKGVRNVLKSTTFCLPFT